MLGDPSAFVETPALTVRRLQLLHGSSTSSEYHRALARALFPSSKVGRRWEGYTKFARTLTHVSAEAELTAAITAVALEDAARAQPKVRADFLRDLHALSAAGSEVAAAQLARILMDRALHGRE
eukprot:2838259-Prymnesium_polylepis.1